MEKETILFKKSGRWYGSGSIEGGDTRGVTVHINFKYPNAKEIIVQCTSDTTAGWSNQDSVKCSSDVWEKNIVGIAPHQKVRIITNAEVTNAFIIQY